MRNILILLAVYMTIASLGSYVASSYAESSDLMLSEQDLTWLSCKPNDDLNKVLRILKDKHKLDMDSMRDLGINTFVAGDPHPAMAWILSVDGSEQDKLNRFTYGRFKESKEGPKIKTNRGIGYGATTTSIYEAYGKNPMITRSKDPGMYYFDLEYPFILQETGQKGKLRFILKHKPDVPENKASLFKIEWYFDKWLMEQRAK